MEIGHLIEKLLAYSRLHLHLDKEDVIFLRNTLLFKLKVDSPSFKEVDLEEIKKMEVPDLLISELETYIKGTLKLDDFACEQLIEDVFGELTPRPSVVIQKYNELLQTSKEEAVKYLYDLNIKSNYVQKTKIAKNIKWIASSGLEVSINLSKPEKDNKEIKKAAQAKALNYPKCVICYENVGYYGRLNHSIRRTLRVAPLKLNNEDWFLQFSPFGYYDEHLIVITNDHIPMAVNESNVQALLDFVNEYPFYFIGANSDLPITGGSILSHEHFQGGRYVFPLMKAKDAFQVKLDQFDDVKISYLDFYHSTLKLTSQNKDSLLKATLLINEAWLSFNDPENEIISCTNNERHSSLTIIAKKENEVYELYIILRNNRTNEEHPDGIFHAHKQYHHIKREGIGLIEAMGLFILPPRLKRQAAYLEKIILENINKEEYLKVDPELILFEELITSLRGETKDVDLKIRQHIDDVCLNILLNVGVFKKTPQGEKSLARFLKHMEEVR